MSRLLMLVAIGAAVYWLLRSYGKEVSRQDHPVVEDMVRCAHCGVHIPRSEGIASGGKFFCSAGHRDAYRK
ncbi:MAG: PP0621 family protein [Gallionella sp.]